MSGAGCGAARPRREQGGQQVGCPQRLPGHYYLQGVREVGSELVLSEDGSFDYLMSYGAVDISASGAWRSDGKQVYLDTPPLQPFSALAGVRAGGEPARPDNLTVRVYYQGRLVRADVAMSSASDDYAGAPRESEGEDGVSAPVASAGELRALAVFVPLPSARAGISSTCRSWIRLRAPSASTWPCRKPRRSRRCIFQ